MNCKSTPSCAYHSAFWAKPTLRGKRREGLALRFLVTLVWAIAPASTSAIGQSADPRGGPNAGIVDIITGNLYFVQQRGRENDRVGIAIATTACNKGTVPASWLALPDNRHPLIAQNLYRLKNDRFQQLGHSWVKHGFGVLANDICQYGCTEGCPSTQLCGGCADSYNAQLNGVQTNLGSRAWIQPFTGFFTAGSNAHAGHTHDGVSHRIIVTDADLDQSVNDNASASYFAEGQYVHPQEYTDADSRAARAMMNNVTYRPITVTGTSGGTYAFAFSELAVTEQPAVRAWTGASYSAIEPEPDVDGQGLLAWKVSNAGNGRWRYEYALYNQNLDRAMNALWVPIGSGAHLDGVGFSAPPNHPGWSGDGSDGSAGFSNEPWAITIGSDSIRWDAERFSENPNANAVRWGTLYNFWFLSDQPPQAASATVGFFKSDDGGTVSTQGPAARCDGDVDDNRNIDLQDLALLLSEYGATCSTTSCAADINYDGVVDLQDLANLLSNFGRQCP